MKIAIVAGEASGDLHAAEVLRELKKLDPQLDAFGIGGDLLVSQGMRLIHHAREMGIGPSERIQPETCAPCR